MDACRAFNEAFAVHVDMASTCIIPVEVSDEESEDAEGLHESDEEGSDEAGSVSAGSCQQRNGDGNSDEGLPDLVDSEDGDMPEGLCGTDASKAVPSVDKVGVLVDRSKLCLPRPTFLRRVRFARKQMVVFLSLRLLLARPALYGEES